MAITFKALDHWPRATMLGVPDSAPFEASTSGFERTLERDRAAQDQALDHAAAFAPCERVIVIGIGGSAMGTRAIVDALAPAAQRHRLILLDHLDLKTFDEGLEGADPKRIGLIVVSRSGGTIEVLAWLREVLGRIHPAAAALITATPDSALGSLAQQRQWPILAIPADIGGRFSVFTPCGLLPLAVLGLPIQAILDGGRNADPILAHQLAQDLKHLLDGGHHRIVQFFYGEALRGLAGWWLQLVSESLGKDGTPLFAAAANGPRDQHSILQLLMQGADRQALLFCRWDRADDPAGGGPDLLPLGTVGMSQLEALLFCANSDALSARGRPVLRCLLEPTAAGMGAFMQTWMRATVKLGALMDLDPFDQPGVEAGKRIALRQLGID